MLSRDAIAEIDAVTVAARELRRVRAEAFPELKGGLRALYRTLELPGANPLKNAHATLDAAVLAAYGFSAKKDLLAQLLAFNQKVAAKIERGEPVTAPGVPPSYPDPKNLVTEEALSKPRPLRAAGLQMRVLGRNLVGRVPSRGVWVGFERASEDCIKPSAIP